MAGRCRIEGRSACPKLVLLLRSGRIGLLVSPSLLLPSTLRALVRWPHRSHRFLVLLS